MHATAYKHINKTGTNIYKQAQAYKGKRQPSKRTQHANNGKPQTDPNKGTVAAVKSAPHPRGGRRAFFAVLLGQRWTLLVVPNRCKAERRPRGAAGRRCRSSPFLLVLVRVTARGSEATFSWGLYRAVQGSAGHARASPASCGKLKLACLVVSRPPVWGVLLTVGELKHLARDAGHGLASSLTQGGGVVEQWPVTLFSLEGR